MKNNTEAKNKDAKKEETHAWFQAFWEVCKNQQFAEDAGIDFDGDEAFTDWAKAGADKYLDWDACFAKLARHG